MTYASLHISHIDLIHIHLFFWLFWSHVFRVPKEERQDAAADHHGPPGWRTAHAGGPEAAVRGQHHELRGTQGARGMEKRLEAKIWEMRQKSMLYIYISNIYI